MITLVGVGHVFDIQAAVRTEILRRSPDLVCLELDPMRFQMLRDREATRGGPFPYRLLAHIQRRIASEYDADVGDEMLIAAETAEELGIQLALIDADARETYQKLVREMTFPEKVRFLFGIIAGLAITKKRVDKELRRFEENEAVYMDQFSQQFPTLKRVLIDERNQRMAKALRDLVERFPNIVAVLGDGHIQEVSSLLPGLDVEVVRLRDLRDPQRKASFSFSVEHRD